MVFRRWFDILRLRIRSLLRQSAVESELDRELRFHLEQEAEKNVQRGLGPSAARLAAARRLGGTAQIQEECRDARRTGWIENFARDTRYAARTLRKAPGFALAIVLTLGLAIGANTAIFSAVYGILLRPLPYRQADRIVRIFFSSKNYPRFPLNPLDLRDMRTRNRSFSDFAAMTRADRQLSGMGRPERLTSFTVTGGYFSLLGIRPELGRDFIETDELPGRGNQVLLSDRLWRARFSADPQIVGRRIMLDDEPYTVAGVMPPLAHPGNEYQSVADGDTVDMWTPFTYRSGDVSRGPHYMEAIARLRDGVTLPQAQADLDAMMAQLGREHPGAIQGWHAIVVSLYEELVSPSRQMLLVLLGAVGLVLLIACANAANLLLARATSRRRELAVRAALGASRSRLVWQMLVESLLVSLAGGAVGAGLAVGGVRALAALAPADLPRISNIHLNSTMFLFALAISLAAGVLFGLAPAMQSARTDPQRALHEGSRGSGAGPRQLWLRNALVVSEVSLACVLLAGAGLLLRSFVNMLRTDAGFRPDQVMTAIVSLPNAKYKTGKDIVGFYERLDQALKRLPGVRAAGIGSDVPWTGYDANLGGFTIEGRQTTTGQTFHARYHIATEDYFSAMGIPLIRGRFFTQHDDIHGLPVMIVNQAMARYWGGEDPVGRRITFSDQPKSADDWFTVVGVVGDVKDHPDSPAAAAAFWWSMPQLPNYFPYMSIAVRARGDAAPMASEIRDAVQGLDPNMAVSDLKPMGEIANKAYSTPRFVLFLVALFAVVAAVLAAIGVYGVVSYSVGTRKQEFGLRMALGASAAGVMRQVVGRGMRLAVSGIVIGVAGALALGQVLTKLLYGVRPTDPWTLTVVTCATAAIAALACYLPARRATTADPAAALRAE